MNADAWVRASDNHLLFVTEVLGAEPDPWQEAALRALDTEQQIAIRSGHGVGKTTLEAWATLKFGLTHIPFRIPVVANSQDQLRDVVWPELKMWANRLPDFLKGQLDFTVDRMFLKAAPEEGFAVARVGNKENPEALQGFHSPNMLFIFEEASGIPEKVFEVGVGALSTPGSRVLMCGNPTRLDGYFYNAFHRFSETWKTIHVSSEDVPRARGHIQKVIEEYGKESNEYRVRVKGEFPSTEEEQVIPRHLIDAAVNRSVDPVKVYKPVWGVDVAWMGKDGSALAKRRGNSLIEPVKTRRGLNPSQVAGWVLQELRETDKADWPSEILVDSIGIGAGVVSTLWEKNCPVPVRGVAVSESPSNRDRYYRLRDELAFTAREWFEQLDCVLPDDPQLVFELSAIHMLPPRDDGKQRVEPNAETKKRTKRSPDRASAFFLTFAGGWEMAEEPVEHRKRYSRKKLSTYGSWMAY